MAIYDRWYKSEKQPDGSTKRVRSADYGCARRWQVRWRDAEGKQRKKNFVKKTGDDPATHATAWDAKVHDDLNKGIYVSPSTGRQTFQEYAEQWRKALTADPATHEVIEGRLTTHAYPVLGGVAMAVLASRPSMIQQWIRGLSDEGLSPATIRSVLTWVSAVFSAATDDGVVTRNPCAMKTVRPPKVERTDVQVWDLARVDAMAAALDADVAALVYLGVGCGMRQGELFGIAAEDIDFLGDRVVHVRRQVRIVRNTPVFSAPKGGKARDIPLPDTAALRLSAHMQAHPPVEVTLPWRAPSGEPVTARLLFVAPDGGVLRRGGFNQRWRKARRAAGVPLDRSHGMHVLRHTAASAWLSQGVDIRTVAEYLGHADPGFTLRTYAHLMPDSADRARRAMDAFLQGTAAAPSALDVPVAGAK